MRIFADNEEPIDPGSGGIQGDSDVLVDVFDAVAEGAQAAYATAAEAVDATYDAAEQYVDDLAHRAEADPIGLAADLAESAYSMVPHVDVDVDENGAFDTTFSAGPFGSVKAHAGNDDEGHFGLTADVKVGLDEAGISWEGRYSETDDGFRVQGQYGAQAVIDGVPVGVEYRAGYEDLGDHGFKATAGTSSGLSADIDDAVEGSVMSGNDVDFSLVDGQSTIGIRHSTEASIEVDGDEVVDVASEQGVAYTWGPDGERIILHDEVSGTLGDEADHVSGTARIAYEYGTDADGNEVERWTASETVAVESETLGVDLSSSSTDASSNIFIDDGADDIVVDGTPAEYQVATDPGLDTTYMTETGADAEPGYAETTETLVLDEVGGAAGCYSDGDQP
ncbi:hypothetical protein [Mycolicibacterium litorale]|uniref:Uncharacterized protein n=1 Tax=Mycolicibacterium litorale TaxID=758802 RepID=A0AAD1MQK1_9MYCO|nr:hypothetical protein [Mycolicibacterium litorale]MCV7413720.1 hypothetical protein [Mycolicibacterium litorale]TDY03397.1 hypothetical protein BCL50_4468 [Mycolicibacterium litorale]BBY15194.1 hypothetical protein MLIT_07860 [Mycolicibacterium litorale]